MQKRWTDRYVDLELLTNSIIDFLKTLDFEIASGKTGSEYVIFAGDSSYFRIDGYVSVTIQGEPKDFTIKLELHENQKKTRSFSPFLMSMFGLGYFLSKRFQSEDAWLKLKKEFWEHLENILVQLTNSSNIIADK